MIPLTGEETGEILGIPGLPAPITGISIDTRTLRPGDLFVALRGERHDGHDYVEQALAAGAAAAVVAVDAGLHQRLDSRLRARLVPVPDTLQALGALARGVRRKAGAKVIAITGSAGKTSTKDLVAALAGQVCRVVATAANQNNEIGVPLTLLSIEPTTEVVVVEMGMRGRGQIAALTQMAEPDVGVITNVYPVHLELLGSLEAIAEAKAELMVGLESSCRAVVPAGSRALAPHVERARCGVVTFAFEGFASPEASGLLGQSGSPERRERPKDGAAVWGRALERLGTQGVRLQLGWPEAEAEIEVAFVSGHRLENAVAAVAACYAAGLPVEDCLPGLRSVVFTAGRGDVMEAGDWLLVNDTYNANPAAVQAAIDDLVDAAAARGRRPVAVLGDMLELGPDEARYHRECGAYAAEAGVQALWGVGRLSTETVAGFRAAAQAGQTAGHVESVQQVAPVLADLRPGDLVLFKASRSVGLEAMVTALQRAAADDATGASPGTRGVAE